MTIIFATFPLIVELLLAKTTFHLVLFIVLTSSVLQRTSLPLLARELRFVLHALPDMQHKLRCFAVPVDDDGLQTILLE